MVESRRGEIAAAVHRHKGRSVWIFGSVARGEERPGSDIDFLVQFEPGSSLFDLMDLEAAAAMKPPTKSADEAEGRAQRSPARPLAAMKSPTKAADEVLLPQREADVVHGRNEAADEVGG